MKIIELGLSSLLLLGCYHQAQKDEHMTTEASQTTSDQQREPHAEVSLALLGYGDSETDKQLSALKGRLKDETLSLQEFIALEASERQVVVRALEAAVERGRAQPPSHTRATTDLERQMISYRAFLEAVSRLPESTD